MTRRTVAGVVTAIAAVALPAGCTGLDARKAEPQGPPLLIGPEAAAKVPPSELPPKESAKACEATARELERHGNVDDAIPLYEKARALDPDGHKAVCRRLAVMYDRKADFTRSAAEYQLALALTPNDPDLLNDIGYSHYCRGEWAKAEEQFARVTKVNPGHKRAWVNRGMALGMLGRTDECLQCFAKVVGEAEARANLGFLLAAQGNTAAAKQQYRAALAKSPDLKLARAALEKLENPEAAEVTRADAPPPPVGKGPRKDVRVPSIYELEERLKLAPAAPPIEIGVGRE